MVRLFAIAPNSLRWGLMQFPGWESNPSGSLSASKQPNLPCLLLLNLCELRDRVSILAG
jgi:hypothetical protein